MSGWAFAAYGTPVTQGSKRHVGHGILVEAAKNLRPWRDTVTSAAIGAGPKLAGPVAVRMVFTLPRPKSAKKSVTWPCNSRADLDKLARAGCDSITAAGLWGDDGQVVDFVRLAKVFPSSAYDSEALPVPGVMVAGAEIIPGGDVKQELWKLGQHLLADCWSRFNSPRDGDGWG